MSATRENIAASGDLYSDNLVHWRVIPGLADYSETERAMKKQAEAIAADASPEQVWLVEHPALYTAGTSSKQSDLLEPDRFPVFKTGRGGQYTYHGPGQRVAYVMLNLARRKKDVRAFVAALETWIIATLGDFGVHGERREDRVGIWVRRPELSTQREDKIAAIGIRLTRWVSYHGISINVEPNLEHFSGIVPCGVSEHDVTSLVDLGLPVTMEDLDVALNRNFQASFGPVTPVPVRGFAPYTKGR